MTTAWRIPLSAHVCTTEDAPAVQRASVYLANVKRHQHDAVLLNKQALANEDLPLCFAMINGAVELQTKADRYVYEAKRLGALPHYGAIKAHQLAEMIFTQGTAC